MIIKAQILIIFIELSQGLSRRQEGTSRLEHDSFLRRESPIRSSFGSGDKYSVNELVNLMRGQTSNTKRGSSRKERDSRHGHLFASGVNKYTKLLA